MSSKPNLVLIDRSIVIARPIAQVFAFVANHENYGLWFPDVVSIVSVTDEPHGTVGKTYSETIRLPTGRERKISIPVVESNPPSQLATEGDFAPLQPRMEYQLTSLGETETEIRWLFTSRAKTPLGRVIVRLLAGKTMAARGEVALPKLKSVLEQAEWDL
ncbi:MAG: SRPBCC family protein [Pseudomonadota bacterium]